MSTEVRARPKTRARAADRPPVEAAQLREHERFLWSLSYRLTGNAADADDIVQETFLRAIERPPPDTTEPWRPWLVRVAINLGRDALRRRRRSYVGPWLPSPIEIDEPPSWEIAGEGGTEGRYDLLESASFAFLLALEALTPQQRAVLLLRDVFDYSVQETSAALGLSEPNVKTTHHRARRALDGYDRERMRPSPALVERSRDALARLLKTIATFDVAAVEALLADDARALSDGGGELLAARQPVTGKMRVAKLLVGLAQHSPPVVGFEVRILNGLPALVMELAPKRERVAKRYVLRCEIDAAGQVTGVHTVLATRKLTRVRPLACVPPQ